MQVFLKLFPIKSISFLEILSLPSTIRSSPQKPPTNCDVRVGTRPLTFPKIGQLFSHISPQSLLKKVFQTNLQEPFPLRAQFNDPCSDEDACNCFTPWKREKKLRECIIIIARTTRSLINVYRHDRLREINGWCLLMLLFFFCRLAPAGLGDMNESKGSVRWRIDYQAFQVHIWKRIELK